MNGNPLAGWHLSLKVGDAYAPAWRDGRDGRIGMVYVNRRRVNATLTPLLGDPGTRAVLADEAGTLAAVIRGMFPVAASMLPGSVAPPVTQIMLTRGEPTGDGLWLDATIGLHGAYTRVFAPEGTGRSVLQLNMGLILVLDALRHSLAARTTTLEHALAGLE